MEDEEDTSHVHQPWWKTANVTSVTIGVLIIAFILLVFKLLFFPPQSIAPQEQPNTPSPTSRPPTSSEDRAEGQIIVKFKPDVPDDVINARLAELNSSVKNKIEGINTTVVTVPVGQEDAVMNALAGDPIVQYAEPD